MGHLLQLLTVFIVKNVQNQINFLFGDLSDQVTFVEEQKSSDKEKAVILSDAHVSKGALDDFEEA